MREEIDYCAMCDLGIHLESYVEEYKWVDGLGYLCSECMDLEQFSHPDSIYEIDAELEGLE